VCEGQPVISIDGSTSEMGVCRGADCKISREINWKRYLK